METSLYATRKQSMNHRFSCNIASARMFQSLHALFQRRNFRNIHRRFQLQRFPT